MNTTTPIPTSLAGEYACLLIRNEEYGIRTSQVRSIVNIPVIRRVPKAPSFIEGVANIGGRIIPLLNPIERFGLSNAEFGMRSAESEDKEQSTIQESTINNQQSSVQGRLILVQLDSSLYGLLVDSIPSISYLTGEMIEPVNPLMVEKDASFIAGMAKDGERLIHLIDMDAFIRAGLDEDQAEREAYELFSAQMSEALAREKGKKSRRFLAFLIGDEVYGVDLAGLKEVIPASRMEKGAAGPDYMAGLVKATGGILPVIDLQKKFGLDPVPYGKVSRVVVIDAGEYDYGILSNSVTEFLNIMDEEIKETPAAISGGKSSHIQGVAMLNGGERLLVLLDEARILDDKEVKGLSERDDTKMVQKKLEKRPEKGEEAITFVVFRVLEMELAFNLEDLSEIIRYKKATKVPKAPLFIRGIVPVKGELVPVIDLRQRFDLQKGEDTGEIRIIVIKKEDVLYGVVADSVSEILRVSRDDLVAPPKIVKGIDSRFIEGMIRIKETDRAPIVLNIEEILGGTGLPFGCGTNPTQT